MKFSIIVPVYNVEDYIEKCICSIINQTYKNFELIIVNDGSPDDSQKIIDKYVKKDKRIKSFIKENGGQSDARNYGLEYISGDYILFVDSDDCIEVELLERLNKTLVKNRVDILRFECSTYDENGNKLVSSKGTDYKNKDVSLCLRELVTRSFVEPPWLYCYNTKFWKKNSFRYTKGRVHEDFGLTLLILYKANTISTISYDGYRYLIRKGSTTNSLCYDKVKKAAYDMLAEGKKLNSFLKTESDSEKKQVISSYVNECLIYKSTLLTLADRKKYIDELRKEKVYRGIYPYNFKKIVKKIVATISINLYIKIFK